jgi:hypothetical protein
MGGHSFRYYPGQPSESGSCRRSTRMPRNILCNLLITQLLTLSLAAQDITGRKQTSTSTSRDQQTTGNTGGGEPTRIITAPQFSVFSDCSLAFGGTPRGSSEAQEVSRLAAKQSPRDIVRLCQCRIASCLCQDLQTALWNRKRRFWAVCRQ